MIPALNFAIPACRNSLLSLCRSRQDWRPLALFAALANRFTIRESLVQVPLRRFLLPQLL
jgi:hypothetical protein